MDLDIAVLLQCSKYVYSYTVNMYLIIMIQYTNLAILDAKVTLFSGGCRIFERWFLLVVDHRRRGLGVQPPAAEEVLIFKSIQSIESYNILYLRPLSIMS